MELVAVAVMLIAVAFGRWSIHIPKSSWVLPALSTFWAVTAARTCLGRLSEDDRMNVWAFRVILPGLILGGLWIGWLFGWIRLKRKPDAFAR